MRTVEELERKLAEPSPALVQAMKELQGDLMLLGVGGKMGPSLARLAMNAIREAGVAKKVIGVSRFSGDGVRQELEDAGVETLSCDLLDDGELQKLPETANIIYMAGLKFGTTGREYMTWAMNAYLPGRVAEKFRRSRMVVFSSGNVYPLTPVYGGGATEAAPPSPVGEYAQSCLGRERVFEYFSRKYGIPMAVYRLNYAVDLRYGVLLEIARAVKEGRPIDLSMGHLNCIWQGDANDIAIRCLLEAGNPPSVINVTGPETLSVRWVAEEMARRLGKEPVFTGAEAPDALLNNSAKAHQLFGYPRVTALQMIEWTAQWVAEDGPTLGKPTHYQERSGKY